MKKLIIALLAITFSLGVACKKEVNEPIKKENFKIEKKANDSEPPVVVIGGENTYPHNTGACYCGQYKSCHRTGHTPSCPSLKPVSHPDYGPCPGCY